MKTINVKIIVNLQSNNLYPKYPHRNSKTLTNGHLKCGDILRLICRYQLE